MVTVCLSARLAGWLRRISANSFVCAFVICVSHSLLDLYHCHILNRTQLTTWCMAISLPKTTQPYRATYTAECFVEEIHHKVSKAGNDESITGQASEEDMTYNHWEVFP